MPNATPFEKYLDKSDTVPTYLNGIGFEYWQESFLAVLIEKKC